jgi:hypothetical protein
MSTMELELRRNVGAKHESPEVHLNFRSINFLPTADNRAHTTMNSLRRINPLSKPSRLQCLRSISTTPRQQQPADLTSFLAELEQPTNTQGTTVAPTTRTSIARPQTRKVRSETGFGVTRKSALDELVSADLNKDIGRQAARRWMVGDVYAPHDLSSVEASKWKKIERRPEKDVFDMMGENPTKHYKVRTSIHLVRKGV